jgi:hypothetical protein
MFTEPTNPAPYIITAYALGTLCTFGFALWLYLDRVRVERYLLAFDQETEK